METERSFNLCHAIDVKRMISIVIRTRMLMFIHMDTLTTILIPTSIVKESA